MGPASRSVDGPRGSAPTAVELATADPGVVDPHPSSASDPGSTVTTSSEVDLPPDVPAEAEPASAAESSGSKLTGLAALREQKYAQPAIVAIGVLLLAIAYLLQARTMPEISEGASQALQGWDMLHGNILLHGWSLSDVSFYTTEVPEYALVEFVKGLNGDTVPIAAAISYFLQIVMAGFLAKGRATGREGWTRALIAVGIMLAPPLGAATALLMSSPDHTGTHVPLLLIYLVLDRVRPRWWLPILITVLLTWATIADALVLVEGTLPIAAVCAIRMYRRRGPWAAQWYDLSLIVGAGLSVGLARVVLKLVSEARRLLRPDADRGVRHAGTGFRAALDEARECPADLRRRLLRHGRRRRRDQCLPAPDRRGPGGVGAGSGDPPLLRRGGPDPPDAHGGLRRRARRLPAGHQAGLERDRRPAADRRGRGGPGARRPGHQARPDACAGGAGHRLRRLPDQQRVPSGQAEPESRGRHLAAGAPPHLRPGRVLEREQHHRADRRRGERQADPDLPELCPHHELREQQGPGSTRASTTRTSWSGSRTITAGTCA